MLHSIIAIVCRAVATVTIVLLEVVTHEFVADLNISNGTEAHGMAAPLLLLLDESCTLRTQIYRRSFLVVTLKDFFFYEIGN